MGLLYQYLENAGVASPIGGTTTCTFFDPLCASNPEDDNCWAQQPTPGVVVLTPVNTTLNYWLGSSSDPGFPISNFSSTHACDITDNSNTSYIGNQVFAIFPNQGAWLECIWTSLPTQLAGGEPPPAPCDTTEDCCCCMAHAHGDPTACLICATEPHTDCGISEAVAQPDGSVATVTMTEGSLIDAYSEVVGSPGPDENNITITSLDSTGARICNTGYYLDGNLCALVRPCPNPNVIPDNFGNCAAPGYGCVWTGYQQQECGGGAFYNCPYGLYTEADGTVWTSGPFVGFWNDGTTPCYATDCSYDTTCGSTYAWTPLPGCDPNNYNYCVGPNACPDHTLPQNDPYGVCDDCDGCLFCDSSGNCEPVPPNCYVQYGQLICPGSQNGGVTCSGDTQPDGNGNCVCPSGDQWGQPDQYGNCNPPPDGCQWCGAGDQCCDQ